MNIVASKSSGKLTASGLVSQRGTLVTGLVVRTNGSATAIVTLRNGTTGSAPEVLELSVQGSALTGSIVLPHPVGCPDGLYVSLSGTGAYCYVMYRDPTLA